MTMLRIIGIVREVMLAELRAETGEEMDVGVGMGVFGGREGARKSWWFQ